MKTQARAFLWPVAGLALAALLVASTGCASKKNTDSRGGAEADSAVFAQATAIEDPAARMAALQKFVSKRPASNQAAEAYVDLISLASKQAPAKVEGILKRFLATDFGSAGSYNQVGWDLAMKGEHLDLAVPILEKAVAKARGTDDKNSLASCLDSEAWARYQKGDYAIAVQRMEEAYQVYGPGEDEIDEHMALIYDAAGMDEKAKPIYMDLLSHMENPAIRESLGKIVLASGGSIDQVNAEIARRRVEGATPAPDFTMANLATGEASSLKDYRGKVVLLNFWHPT